MQKFIITGPSKLNGIFKPKGAKNAVLKMLAASILTQEKIILRNVPKLTDIDMMINLLNSLGVVVVRDEETLTIDSTNIQNIDPDPIFIKKFRGSVVIIGPMLAKFNKINLPQPGGCLIGTRPIDTHLNAFKEMGATIKEEGEWYKIKVEKLKGAEIILEEASVTATENIMMAATLAQGTTLIKNAAMEPEIIDLANMLKKMGAKINGVGTPNIKIDGVKKLNGTDWTILPDRIEIGTIAIGAAVTGGEVVIDPIIPQHLELPLLKFKRANINFKIEKSGDYHKMIISKTTKIYPFEIKTQAYPGFPTDLQAPMSVLATQAGGTSSIFETMFESRLNYSRELVKMGAKINLENSRESVIHGPTPLKGKRITSLDLRAGATLILAAIIAEGESEILHAEHIDRGYADIDARLNKIGAHIERIA